MVPQHEDEQCDESSKAGQGHYQAEEGEGLCQENECPPRFET
jgi:hypothetical protein